MGYRFVRLHNGWQVLSYTGWSDTRCLHGLITRGRPAGWDKHPDRPEDRAPDFARRSRLAFEQRLHELLVQLDIEDWGVAATRQVHGATVLWNPPVHVPQRPEADGMWTDRSEVLLVITVADCVPIWIYDPELPAVGIVHAGWRGTVRGILLEALQVLEAHGSSLTRTEIVLGPAILKCCYAVGIDVIETVTRAYPEWAPYVLEQRGATWFFDLFGLNILQARMMGIRRVHIHPIRLCTYCNPQWFFSHRRGDTQRMLAFIGLRSPPVA